MPRIPRPDMDRLWTKANIVYLTYTLFLAGFYFVPNAVDLYKFYIAAVFLPGVLLLRESLNLACRSRIFQCLLAYIVYMLLSSLWSEHFSINDLWRDLRYVAYILVFILLTVLLFACDPRLPITTAHLVTLVAALAAAVSIALFEPAAQLPVLTEERMTGIGIAKNMNTSAFIYGYFGVIALHLTRRHWGEVSAWAFAACFAVILLFVVLTQSNTALLALTSSCALLFLANARPNRMILLAGMSLVVLAGIYLGWSLGLLNTQTDEGFTLRFPIWDYGLQKWQEAPLFGNGLQKTIVFTPEGEESPVNYAHSLFLATLRDGGLLGLFLLLPVYALALRQGLKTAFGNGNSVYLSLFCFGIVCVLVDVDQFITRPRELWIMLWLPLGCLIACELGAGGAAKRTSSLENSDSH